MMPKLVYIVEDEEFVSDLLRHYLSHECPDLTVETFPNGNRALEACTEKLPNLALVDVILPEISGLDVARELRAHFPSVRVLLMSASTRPGLIQEAMQSGAHGFVSKGAAAETFRTGIETLLDGGVYFTMPSVARESVQPSEPVDRANLTAREIQVLKMVAEGYASKEIGAVLNISHRTVEKHREVIKRKTGLHDTARLTRYAMQMGLLERS